MEPKILKKTTKELARELGLLRKRSSGNSVNKIRTSNQLYAYLIVLDFESTCWKDTKARCQEIIEFPAVLLNTCTGEIEQVFHHYVQPQESPILSEFCQELTGIKQAQVEDGIPLNLCLARFNTWLKKLGNDKQIVYNAPPHETQVNCTFVTWSDWDLGVCLHYECRRKQIRKPPELTAWIDLRATYRNFYSRKPNGLNGALQDLGIDFIGREHSGLDDAKNTAKLAWRMMRDGCVMKITKSASGSVTTVGMMKQPTVKHNATKPPVDSERSHETSSCSRAPEKTASDQDRKQNAARMETQLANYTLSRRTVSTKTADATSCVFKKPSLKKEIFKKPSVVNSNLKKPSPMKGSGKIPTPVKEIIKKKSPAKETSFVQASKKPLRNEGAKSASKDSAFKRPSPVSKRSFNNFSPAIRHDFHKKTVMGSTPSLEKINNKGLQLGISDENLTESNSTNQTPEWHKKGLQTHQASHFRTPLAQKSVNQIQPASSMKRTPPMCQCGRRATRRLVQTPGPNTGRAFFCCPLGRTTSKKKPGCGFFKWDVNESVVKNKGGYSPYDSTSCGQQSISVFSPLQQPNFDYSPSSTINLTKRT